MSPCKRKHLPPEIIESILPFLPTKSIGRFKSVSKTWYSLISDPKFIKTHIRHQKTTKLILHNPVSPLYSLDISSLVDLSATVKEEITFRRKRIWGSCNGLVLAQDLKDIFFLMNPTTKELWKVPLNPFALRQPEEYSYVTVMYGFGYVPSTDDYKIVSITETRMSHESRNDMFVSVYSLRGNSWRKLPNPPYYQRRFYPFPGALVNRNLHWITRTRSGCSIVIAFSLENEDFNEIQLPGSITKAMSYIPILYNGKLAIFGRDSSHDLWVMEEYGVSKSWTKVCSMNGINGDVRPVCLLEESDQDVVLGDLHDKGMVLVYNIGQRRCRDVHIDGVTSRFSVQGTYVESLESPAKYIKTAP